MKVGLLHGVGGGQERVWQTKCQHAWENSKRATSESPNLLFQRSRTWSIEHLPFD